MPRRSRQLTTLKVVGFLVAVAFALAFVGGVAFEMGRYVARVETDRPAIGA